ncbi:MAG TPA: hypothetical protein VKK79_04955 [Candidatus Lokiarchaeia archaeon]|nr:hypothetical protein [Candidatus Lokiarchaeia archaeon]
MLNYLKAISITKMKKAPDFLDQELDFFDDKYSQYFKKLVDAFTDGLESIGISPVVTSRQFYLYFKEPVNEPDLKTPSTWIDQKFRPYIRIILGDELVHFFEGIPGNIVEKCRDLHIIAPAIVEELSQGRENLPRFALFLQSFSSLYHIYEDAKQIENLLRFERVEENLQTLYFLAQILADADELKLLNTSLIKKFLVQHQSEWVKKPLLLNASAPSAILSAVFLIDLLNIDFDLTPIFEKQKELVQNLFQNTEDPLKSKPFELYDALLSLAARPQEIGQDLRESLQNLAITWDLLEEPLSLPSLGTILETIYLVNPTYVVPDAIRELFQVHVQRFWKGDGFVSDASDDTTNPVATYFGFTILKRLKLLKPEDVAWFFRYFVFAFGEAISNVDYVLPDSVAEVFYCKKFFNAIELEPNFRPFGFPLETHVHFLKSFIKDILECPTPVSGEVIIFAEPEKLQENVLASRQINQQAVAQEISQLLREPKLIYEQPNEAPEQHVPSTPVIPITPIDVMKKEGKVDQNGNWDEIVEEMDTTLNSIGTFLGRAQAPEPSEPNNNPESTDLSLGEFLAGSKQAEIGDESETESPLKSASMHGSDSRLQSRKRAAFEEGLALESRREQLSEWLREAMPRVTKFQVEAYVAEILEAEKGNKLESYLEFLHKTKGVDTRDFPS